MTRDSESAKEPKREQVEDILFRRAAESSVDGIAIVDTSRRVLYVNEARAHMHGYEPDEIIGRDVAVLSAPESGVPAIAAAVIETGRWSGESVGLRKDGSRFAVRQTITLVDDPQGRPVGMLSITRDITDKKASEEALELRTRQLTDLLEASREMNAAIKPIEVLRLLVKHGMSLASASAGTAGQLIEGRMVFREYNRGGELMPIDYSFRPNYGVPGWVIANRKAYISNDAASDPEAIPHIRKALGFDRLIDVPMISREGELIGCLELHNRADERPFTEEDVELLTGLANQAAVALVNAQLTEDISRWADTLRRNEETLRLVVEGSPDFFFYIHDARGVFTYVSPSVETITGHSAEEWKSHYTRFLTDNPVNDDVVRRTEATLAAGDVTPSYPVEVFHKDGRRIMLEVYERPIIDDGEIAGIRGVARDVTELRRAEAAEAALRRESEAHMRKFYRDTILSVTDGRLEIVDPENAHMMCSDPLFPPIEVRDARDVALARDEVGRAALQAGMDPSLMDDLVLCVGEATTNAYKHAGGGVVCVSDEDDSILVKVSDSGSGMDSLALPKLTLMRGYSTQKSLGMGYAAILASADRIYLSTGIEGTTVVIEIPKQPKTPSLELANLPDLW